MSGRIRIIVEKEWMELIRRKTLVVLMIVLPAALLAVTTAAALAIPTLMSDQCASEEQDLARILSMVQDLSPDLAALGPKVILQVLLLRQIILLLLLVPVFVAMSVAAYGIVGEKVNRSLEPLLATPVTTTELLVGKCLASVIPGVALTWGLFGFFAAAVALFAPPGAFGQAMNATALCLIFLICPLIGLLGLSVVIITSARATDPRSAQQIGALVVVPIICVITSQMAGSFMLTPLMTLGAAVALAVVTFFVLRAGIALFYRETILTRWR